jgi:hypothetical protein
MKWYEKKFSDFFRQWEKGDLLLQDNQSYFGQIEGFNIEERFEDSRITFICYQPSGEEKTVALKEVRHFHAYNGPILNIGKYVKIAKMGEQNRLNVVDGGRAKSQNQNGSLNLVVTNGTVVDEGTIESDGNKVICVAFGLEFYTNEKRARLFKQDAMQILLSRFEESAPLLSVADRAPVDLTPTFSRLFRVFRFLKPRKPKDYVGKHSTEETASSVSEEIEKTRT